MRWRTANNNRRQKERWARMDDPESFYVPLFSIRPLNLPRLQWPPLSTWKYIPPEDAA